MNLKNYKWPIVTDLDMAFPTLKADKTLLAEAHERGFIHGDTPYERMFSKLFFEGGKLDFKEGLEPEFKSNATAYLKAFMGSWEPKHEHKQSICALILSELVNPPTA